jgi:Chs5-Arf1p-binding protein BUD7/BCH1
VAKIGWDELLKTRSAVFVMEEEYRMQKAHTDSHPPDSATPVIHEDGSVTMPNLSARDADDNASTKGVRSATHSPNPSQINGADIPNGIPTIRISTESQRETIQQPETEQPDINGANHADDSVKHAAGDSLEKPVQAAAGEPNEESNSPLPSPSHEAFSFSNKRLCERWLDNLFMVLYEVSILVSSM